MSLSTIRRLTLADLAILVAATSLGFWVLRIAQEARDAQILRYGAPIRFGAYDYTISWRIGNDLNPFILSMSIALLIARLLKPRPDFRDILRQPGVIACLAILAEVAFVIAIRAGHMFIEARDSSGFNYALNRYLTSGIFPVHEVAFTWATLAVSGAWQPEPSWIDRAGRALGIVSILLWVAVTLSL